MKWFYTWLAPTMIVLAGTAQAACISTSDGAQKIQAELDAGRDAILCQYATFNVTSTIRFRFANQKIMTEGDPGASSARATLAVAHSSVATLINGHDVPGVQIRSVRLDGGRVPYGYSSPPLMDMGGGVGDNQVITFVEAFEPRGWTALSLAKGGGNGCSGATVTWNTIGPAGRPWNFQWADGISLQCRDSYVAHNHIFDATDGGIVIFGAPGSLIEKNLIESTRYELFGGINMVDPGPWVTSTGRGDYTGTIVRNNTIRSNSTSGFIHIGIGMGPYIWWCETLRNTGATVQGNHVSGRFIGYHYAVSGVENWTVTGNTYAGGFGCREPTPACTTGGNNSFGRGLLKDPRYAFGTFQSDFVNGTLEDVLGISVSSCLSQ